MEYSSDDDESNDQEEGVFGATNPQTNPQIHGHANFLSSYS